MPGIGDYSVHRRTWRTMDRGARKAWYRVQQTRVARGLPALPKP